jgi:hypothetical protein
MDPPLAESDATLCDACLRLRHWVLPPVFLSMWPTPATNDEVLILRTATTEYSYGSPGRWPATVAAGRDKGVRTSVNINKIFGQSLQGGVGGAGGGGGGGAAGPRPDAPSEQGSALPTAPNRLHCGPLSGWIQCVHAAHVLFAAHSAQHASTERPDTPSIIACLSW